LPSPNEALAEVALITELSKHQTFQPKSYVYSYRLAEYNDSSGVFTHYFNGLKERQRDIAKACKKSANFVVLYTDIKRFYPSIKFEDAKPVWLRKTDESDLEKRFIELGNSLLRKQAEVSQIDETSNGILTGPIFSHIVANLLLDDIDILMHDLTGGHYWRYVDDVVLVGTSDEVDEWRSVLQAKLDEFELELHDGKKDFVVSSENWLEGEDDFESDISQRWTSLIADTKRYLIKSSTDEVHQSLQHHFLENNIRIPLVDYSIASREVPTLSRFSSWLRKYRKWSYKKVMRVTPERLTTLGFNTRAQLLNQLENLLDNHSVQNEYAYKRLIPKLRFIAGRLILLASEQELLEVSSKLKPFSELNFLCSILECIATRDVSEILRMGTNATQAACQVLKVSPEPVTFSVEEIDEVIELSLAVLTFNGIGFESDAEPSKLRIFAGGQKLSELMLDENRFIREITCLHGIAAPRHSAMLCEAFDVDEELAMDVINQLQSSSHC